MPLAVRDARVVHDTGSTRGCSLERNAAGELVCVFTDSLYGGPGGRLLVIFSSDEGKTWSAPERMTASVHGAEGSIIYALGMTRLSDDRLLIPLCDLIGKPSENAATKFITAVSSDGAHSWDLKPIETEWDEVYPYGKVLELSDGTLLAPIWGTRVRGERRRSALLASGDAGASWKCGATIACDRFGMIPSAGFMETSVVALPRGRLLAVISQSELVGYSERILFTCASDDEGRTWSHYEPLEIVGGLPALAWGPSGKLLLAYRMEPGEETDRKRRGIAVRESEDEGESWSPELFLKNPKGSLEDEPDAAYPALMNLPDGKILAVFSALNPGEGKESASRGDDASESSGLYFLAANILEETQDAQGSP